MVKFLRATAVAALVSLIALSGCSNTNSDSSDKQDTTQEEVELDESLTVGEMTVEYPSSWSRRPGSSEGIIYVDMDNDGLMMISAPQDASGISSESDYKTAIDSYNSGLEGSGFEIYGEDEMYTSGAQYASTCQFDADLSGEAYTGISYTAFSSTSFYSMLIAVPEDEFDDSSDALAAVVVNISIDESSQPAQESSVQQEAGGSTSTTATGFAPEGTSLVGSDIPAGTYKLTASSSYSGYWEVRNSAEPDAEIVGNENFDGSSYVTVSDGQYLTLSRCTGQLQ